MQTADRRKASGGAAADYRGLARAGYAIAALFCGVLGCWALFAPADSVLAGAEPVEVERPPVLASAAVRLETELTAASPDPLDDAQAVKTEPVAATPAPDIELPAKAPSDHPVPEPATAPKAEIAALAELPRNAVAAAETPQASDPTPPALASARRAQPSAPAFTARAPKEKVKARPARRFSKSVVAAQASLRSLSGHVTILIGRCGSY